MATLKQIGVGITAAGIISVFGGVAGYNYGTMEDVTITVDQLRTKLSNNDGELVEKYLVSGTYPDGKQEVFENTDSTLHWKFNSSDVQLIELKQGHTYNAKVYGFRVPFLSWYRNIADIEKVSSSSANNAKPIGQKQKI